jgi:ABC-type multidrug transport system fused ATPase/permease subunit
MYFDTCTKVGLQVRTALTTAIYRKSLHLSNEAMQGTSSGAIVNYMAKDAGTLVDTVGQLHNLWSQPIRLLVGLVILIRGLGVAGLVGFLAVIIMFPLNKWAMELTGKYTKQVFKLSDSRIKLLNEVLGGMRVIKYYSWEERFSNKVHDIREKELETLKKAQTMRAYNMFLINANPVALSVGTFVTYGLTEGSLSAAKAFEALALFQLLLWPLLLLPRTITAVFVDGKIALGRIEGFLHAGEIAGDEEAEKKRKGSLDRSPEENPNFAPTTTQNGAPVAISVSNASFAWDQDTTLFDIDIAIPKGALAAVVGGTGMGKSSLISAMLGEMVVVGGSATIHKQVDNSDPGSSKKPTVAYVSQLAWIFGGTVRDNIIFGMPYEKERYLKALRVTHLEHDVNTQFASGDMTEIGEKGVNLSGGQKQRLSLARAIYADADVYFLDDPLSALDAHVGAGVFRDCICEHLKEKTVVLVMNQVQFCPEADLVVALDHGRALEVGPYPELMARGGAFAKLMQDYGGRGDDEEEAGEAEAEEPKEEAAAEVHKEGTAAEGKLTQKETKGEGGMKAETYAKYINAIGISMFYPMIAFYVLQVGCDMLSNTTLAAWAESSRYNAAGKDDSLYNRNDNFFAYNYATRNLSAGTFTALFAMLSLTGVFSGLACNLLGFRGAVHASRSLHQELVDKLIHAPMYFYDMTPLGRIVNRFTGDMSQIDGFMMYMIQLLLNQTFRFFGTLIMMGVTVSYSLVPLVPLSCVFAMLQRFYRQANVDLKRLDAVSRSPIYSQFSETINGMSTIRAYGAQNRMARGNAAQVDKNGAIFIVNMQSNRWLSVRLETLGALMITSAALFVVLLRHSLTGAVTGLLLAYTSQLTSQLNMMVRMLTLVEGSFNAVERIVEYIECPQERTLAIGAPRKPADESWPKEGKVEIKDLKMSYRPGLPLVLKGLTVTIESQEKVGVVGRTGAGKSSLFQALFRIVEADSGQVLIDGEDIAKYGLPEVRTKLSIIPQDPVLFSGTLRFNLDPFDSYTDEELWDALKRANLEDVVRVKPDRLLMTVAENGENFSVGQRQLVCLGRALLRSSKVLVLDEATANVDPETDALIQKTIRESFSDRTTLTIAHRLNTIIDADKVLVLESGRLLEFDTPATLLKDPSSEFSSMVDETGAANAVYLRKLAYGDIDIQQELEATLERQASAKAAMLQATGTSFGQGPLMRQVVSSFSTIVDGVEGRHTDAWKREKHEFGVSHDLWMHQVAKMVSKVDRVTNAAMDEDGMDWYKMSQAEVERTGDDFLSGHTI